MKELLSAQNGQMTAFIVAKPTFAHQEPTSFLATLAMAFDLA
jgi:hypothetical protein